MDIEGGILLFIAVIIALIVWRIVVMVRKTGRMEAACPFQPGTTVRHKSGGFSPNMTVYLLQGSLVWCRWYADGFSANHFYAEELKKVDD